MKTARYYGISTGDGNDGVSHLFPRYIVKTADPYKLARLAAINEFKEGEGHAWAKENMLVEGEAEYTISVCFLEGPEGETAFGAAWFIVEVFPASDELVSAWKADPYKIAYESLEDAFSAEFIAAHTKD